jgi:GR25 family glycosyltransferase involved in LPS biosynthesis
MYDIYVINLEERKDRLEHIKKYFSEYNIIRVEAIKHIEGYKGCFLSHKKCIQIAKEKKLKYIIVVEDDCLPLDNFLARLENIIKFLESYNNWDLLRGGGFHICPFHIQGKINTSTDNLYKTNGGYCTHFIIYNNTSYDYFLEQDISRPIDHIWQNNLQCIVPIPFIATQIDDFSDISNSIQTTFSRRIRLNNKRLSKYINDNNIKHID